MSGKIPLSWIEVSLTVPAPLGEEVCALIFEETGQGSFSEEKKVADREAAVIRTYLPKDETLRGRLHRLKRRVEAFHHQFPGMAPLRWDLRQIFDENWQENWKRFFKPLRIATGLIVCPTWEVYEPKEGERVIRLDPGQAFGTGGHASTRLCLKAMESLRRDAASSDYWFSRILDIGTGTGILALAAVCFRAHSVLAVDNDPQAVEAAINHVTLNHMEDKIRVERAAADTLEGTFSLILANLTLQDLCTLAPRLKRLSAPGGVLVTSGILVDQVPSLKEALARESFLFQSGFEEEEWACLLFRSDPNGKE